MLVFVLVGIVVVLIIVGLVVVAFTKSKSRPDQPLQEIVERDRAARVSLEKLECQECGAELDQDSITIEKGITLISCSYCGSTYQWVEEPEPQSA
jgi:hypothetical protein